MKKKKETKLSQASSMLFLKILSNAFKNLRRKMFCVLLIFAKKAEKNRVSCKIVPS
jgi:hypothetical protein